MDTSRFVTAVYGILDPGPGTFTYTNCGHNPPLLLRGGGVQEFLQTGRRAVGMLDSQPTPTRVVTLAPGDTLVFYTDGVVEVSDARDVEWAFVEDALYILQARPIVLKGLSPARKRPRAAGRITPTTSPSSW
jgi:sigma-B regulation protein RsbU (phosphoserine phosphatase)